MHRHHIELDDLLAAGRKKCGRHLKPVRCQSTVQHIPAQIGGLSQELLFTSKIYDLTLLCHCIL